MSGSGSSTCSHDAERAPVELVRDFIEGLSRCPSARPRLTLELTDVVLYPVGRRPANFDDVVRALGDPTARKLFGRDLVTLGEATAILQCSGLDLAARAKKLGELYGLCTPHGWLFSRSRVRELRDLDMIRKWLVPEALATFEPL